MGQNSGDRSDEDKELTESFIVAAPVFIAVTVQALLFLDPQELQYFSWPWLCTIGAAITAVLAFIVYAPLLRAVERRKVADCLGSGRRGR